MQELVADETHSTIRGVRIEVDSGAEETVFADLVVDAGGRGSSSPAWLEGLGYARAQEEKIEIGIGYTTRVYRRRPADLGGKLVIVVAGSGPNWRNGTILFQTEDRRIVSIGGISATMRRTTTRCSQPMRVRCRHPTSTISWPMPSR